MSKAGDHTEDGLAAIRKLIEELRLNSSREADVCARAAETILRMMDALHTLANMQKPIDPDPVWNSGFEAALVDVSKLARYGLHDDGHGIQTTNRTSRPALSAPDLPTNAYLKRD